MDSPRGRIYLMKAGVERRQGLTPAVVQHFDSCLGCLACVTACPSGVQYGPLIEQTRAQVERTYPRGWADRVFRRALLAVVPYPGRMRAALLPLALLGDVVRAVGRWVAHRSAGVAAAPAGGAVRRLAAAMALAPQVSWRGLFDRLPELTASSGPARARVALLSGCVQRLAFPDVNHATVRVLAAEGCEVCVPAGQGCCGALPLHAGAIDAARQLARHNIAVFEKAGVERIVVNAAGCGSAMKEYGELLHDDVDWAPRARAFSEKVRDVSQLLAELGPPRAPRHPVPARVVYHDACHLAHGQGVRSEPRALLTAIPGVALSTPAEAEICCGSAGIYNLVQPEPAAQLGERKARHIAALSPDMIATANPGCIIQIATAGRGLGYNWPVFHPIEIIDASIRGVDPRARDAE
jgi:glycolate oxidase iron-sulfur subunit